jgi:hypothetical protein
MMGPEGLLVNARIDPRVELAEYARLEYPERGPLYVEGWLRSEAAFLPARKTPSQRLLRWAARRLHLGRAVPERGAEATGAPLSAVAEEIADARELMSAPLAALPAYRAVRVRRRDAVPLSALPALGRP